MEVYDRAHELARALARSNEYRDFRLCRAKLESNSSNLEILKDFRRKQVAMELALMSGKAPEEADKKAYEESYRIISLNPTITAYLAAEERVARMLRDIQKILLESLPEWGKEEQQIDNK
jgi:cell fate (sporulation/competence/biofilm development) regulator YlbF (YheA/YmcA/DUF963 family)